MRPLQQLDNRTLLVLKTALDEYQRHQQTSPELAKPFLFIIEKLIDSIKTIDVWALRRLINTEDERRSRHATMKVVSEQIVDLLGNLGDRELEVLRLIGEGFRSEDIMDLMGIAYRTLANHKDNITHKLKLGSAKDLVKFAIDNLAELKA
jgi:DNA-binding CsgD family transcriptional regulator